jgi:flagellar assembly factor FliW
MINATATERIIQFEEGLIGFYDCKSFLLVEREDIAPFLWLQSTERPDVGFLVIDPALVVHDYKSIIPHREWESLGINDSSSGLVFVTCSLGSRNAASTGNLQAPLLVNYHTKTGKQIILTETGLTSRHPLL